MKLEDRIERIAPVPILLVGTDYDGTISPLVDDPMKARPHPDALVALRNLSKLPRTHVAVISGRSLRDLSSLASFPDGVHLVGSHGSEFDLDFHKRLPEDLVRLRKFLHDRLYEIAAEDPGFVVEEKPGSFAFHYRNAGPDRIRGALKEIEADIAASDGVFVKRGKKVIELGVVETSKGSAFQAIRHRVGASAAVYFGDDETDEDVFEQFTGPDIAVKVGDGPTAAPFRIHDPVEAAKLLARLCEAREKWLKAEQYVDIEQHSMLSDQRTAALVTPGGRIVWFCAPRIDSSALFAEILGGPVAGYFSVRPADSSEPGKQTYRPDSFSLETEWDGLKVTDFLDCSWDLAAQRAGRSDLVRLIEGRGAVDIEFAPRPDFGRIPTPITVRENGLEIEETVDPIVLYSPGVRWSIREEGPQRTAHARVDLNGEALGLELRYGTGNLRAKRLEPRERLRLTDRYWSSWVEQLNLPRVAAEHVRRSALVLKGLCHGPTGAIAAAPTTSLPEHVGGVRNWDYRYCWLRDASLACSALVRLGSYREATGFLNWLLGILDEHPSPERLHPVYTVTGSVLPPEAEITDLPGYRGSRPVRVGNAASGQLQLDVFGFVMDLIYVIMRMDAPITSEHWKLVKAMATAVENRWRAPDHGIWEVRARRRHYVHSKVMCWVTVDRACRISEHYLGRENRAWAELRDTIAAEVMERGWHEDAEAFTIAYESPDLDAAALEIGLKGLVHPQDRRFAATVEKVQRFLARGGTVYRYRCDDGLPGFEGGFHLCTSWLVRSLLLIGRRDEAEELFQRMLALAGPTGLLSEEYGPRTRRALGNHPQAYSHIGVIEAALALDGSSRP